MNLPEAAARVLVQRVHQGHHHPAIPSERQSDFCFSSTQPDEAVWTIFVIPSPGFDFYPGILQVHEPMLVQTLIPHFAIEVVDKSGLDRLPRLNKARLDLFLVSPASRTCPRTPVRGRLPAPPAVLPTAASVPSTRTTRTPRN